MLSKTAWPTSLLILSIPIIGLGISYVVARYWIPLEALLATFPILVILTVCNVLALWISEKRRTHKTLPLTDLPHVDHHQELLSNRHQDLGVLAAGIAHELGQPLSAARVDIEGLHLLRQLGREPDPEQTQRILSRVGTCILTMTQIIGHLRELANAPNFVTCQPLIVDDIIRAVMGERNRWDITGIIQIEWLPPAQPLQACGDALSLRLILVNLLRNACESISLPDPAIAQIRIVLGPGPRIDIHDCGPGIPAEHLSRIFEPYTSSKNGHHGVGLSLARISAERMGAQLSAASTPGIGSTFTLTMTPV